MKTVDLQRKCIYAMREIYRGREPDVLEIMEVLHREDLDRGLFATYYFSQYPRKLGMAFKLADREDRFQKLKKTLDDYCSRLRLSDLFSLSSESVVSCYNEFKEGYYLSRESIMKDIFKPAD